MAEIGDTETTQPLCRVQHPLSGRQPGARIVACNRPAGHDGDHDELVDGEPGHVTWSDPEPETPAHLAWMERDPDVLRHQISLLEDERDHWRGRAQTAEALLAGLGWTLSHEGGYDVWTPPAPVGRDTQALDVAAIEARAATAYPQQLRAAGAMLPDAHITPTIRKAIEAAIRVATVDVPALAVEVRRLWAELDSERTLTREAADAAVADATDRAAGEDGRARRVWAAALRYGAGVLVDRAKYGAADALTRLADRIETDALSPWAQDAPVDRSHPAAAGPEATDPPSGTPEPAGDGHGLILGRALLDRVDDVWQQIGPDCWREAGGARYSRAEIAETYGPVREVLLVSPSAGPILDAARRLVVVLRDGASTAGDVARAQIRLWTAVDAATGNQPDGCACGQPDHGLVEACPVGEPLADWEQGVEEAARLLEAGLLRLREGLWPGEQQPEPAPEPAECETCGRSDLATTHPPRCTRHVDVPPTLAELAAQYRRTAGDPEGDPDDQPGPAEAADWTALADLVEATRGTAVIDSSLHDAARRLADVLETAHAPETDQWMCRGCGDHHGPEDIADGDIAPWCAMCRKAGRASTPEPAGFDREIITSLAEYLAGERMPSPVGYGTAAAQLRALLADRDRLATGQAPGAVVAAWSAELDEMTADRDRWQRKHDFRYAELEQRYWDLAAARVELAEVRAGYVAGRRPPRRTPPGRDGGRR